VNMVYSQAEQCSLLNLTLHHICLRLFVKYEIRQQDTGNRILGPRKFMPVTSA
jgi:hypothetical protein